MPEMTQWAVPDRYGGLSRCTSIARQANAFGTWRALNSSLFEAQPIVAN
jgi:hypothetical protein